jgi:hypothetical protein
VVYSPVDNVGQAEMLLAEGCQSGGAADLAFAATRIVCADNNVEPLLQENPARGRSLRLLTALPTPFAI